MPLTVPKQDVRVIILKHSDQGFLSNKYIDPIEKNEKVHRKENF